jgi:hypothetical protein
MMLVWHQPNGEPASQNKSVSDTRPICSSPSQKRRETQLEGAAYVFEALRVALRGSDDQLARVLALTAPLVF